MKKITITLLMKRYKFCDLTKELATVWEHNPVGTLQRFQDALQTIAATDRREHGLQDLRK